MNWRDSAACRGMDTDLFFPGKGESNGPHIRTVRDVCGRCPVRDDCLDEAVNDPDVKGIWAATTWRQRARLRRTANRNVPIGATESE